MNNKIEKVMTAIQKMPENKVTLSIIIPLLKHIGYKRVEFFGGVNEEGKDIIFWEESKIGDQKLCVAQVKHFKLTNKAADNKSFQTIINQLVMCFEKRLVNTEKQAYYPKEVFLISTYPIDIKTIKTRFSENPNLPARNIEIIDGIKFAKLLIESEQPIVKEILGANVNFTKYFSHSINNKILLKALGFSESIPIKRIYTDIDFSLGRNTTELLFSSDFNADKKEITVEQKEWYILKDALLASKDQFELDYINLSVNEIETNYNEKIEESKLWEVNTKEIKNEIYQLKQEQKKIEKEFQPHSHKRRKLIFAKHDLTEELNGLNASKKKEELKEEIKKVSKQISLLDKKEKPLKEKINEIENKEKELKELEEEKPVLSYLFEIDGKKLANKLLTKRVEIEDKVKLFNKYKPSTEALTDFVREGKEIIDSSSALLNNRIILNVLYGDENNHIVFRKDLEKTRLKLPIDKMFDTRHNITLLGEAGAGKTTCLQMYALNNEHNTKNLFIWAPLAHILQNWSKPDKENETVKKMQDEKINNFNSVIFEYLISKDISLSKEELNKILQTKEFTLLLDGLDEAIKNNPWLPKAIIKLTKLYPKAQIIVTSRMAGQFTNELPFFIATLLPFTEEQRDDFINKWFGNKNLDAKEAIKKHLSSNESISSITRNPLLTTTLCVIATHRLPLPQTEVKLYDERLQLLTGYYDNVKNIDTRISITPQNLELLSQKLAYSLHSKGVREMTRDELETESVKSLKNHLNMKDAIKAFNELIDPCNIIVPMTADGKYGFGHLRYQEHLAARELNTNRNINVERLLSSEWWLDTLVLYSQMSESIEWLVNSVGFHIEIKSIKETIHKMIVARPIEEQRKIRKNLKEFKKQNIEIFETESLDLY